jgi:hypothetical protein
MTRNDFIPDALKDLLERSGASYNQNGHSFKMECPRCGKKDKLWILKHNGYFVCWHCKETENFKGRCEYALAEVLGQSVGEVAAKLYIGGVPPGNMLDVDLKDFEDDSEFIVGPPVLQEVSWPIDSTPCTSRAGAKGYDYLLSRGITPAMMDHYQLRYRPSQKRVLFPVIMNGKLYGWQGRAIYSTEGTKIPKILTSEGMRREFMLMFHDNLMDNRVMRTPHAIICEGPVDALKATLCGGNVATMGKAVSKPQLELIRARGIKKVYLALDPDAADEVSRLARDLGDLETYLLMPPEGKKDLGECTFEEVLYQFSKAEPFSASNLFVGLKLPHC